jgi:uncharacterized damage-inducible protein DinB
MSITDSLLPEFDHEMATTRRVLERVPADALGWKPHAKSMTLGQLAAHIANLTVWCCITLEKAALELDGLADEPRLRQAETRDGILQAFDSGRAAARTALAAQSDAQLLVPWTLRKGGEEIFTMPRISAIRSFVMNHLIHHRGQLTVYLRLNDVPLPPVYGPTADEQ